LGAPKGIGVLYVRPGTHLTAQILGGHHERDRRAGTENVPSAIAMGAAGDSLTQHGETEHAHMAHLRDQLEQGILAGIPGTTVNGDSGHRLPNTTNIRFDGIGGEAMVIALDLKGFAVSSGSACSSGAIEPSHVLLAMGLTPEQARSSIRFSLGPSNTKAQIEALIQATTQAAAHLRRGAPSYSHV
jgi:cysteine desulfurase